MNVQLVGAVVQRLDTDTWVHVYRATYCKRFMIFEHINVSKIQTNPIQQLRCGIGRSAEEEENQSASSLYVLYLT